MQKRYSSSYAQSAYEDEHRERIPEDKDLSAFTKDDFIPPIAQTDDQPRPSGYRKVLFQQHSPSSSELGCSGAGSFIVDCHHIVREKSQNLYTVRCSDKIT